MKSFAMITNLWTLYSGLVKSTSREGPSLCLVNTKKLDVNDMEGEERRDQKKKFVVKPSNWSGCWVLLGHLFNRMRYR